MVTVQFEGDLNDISEKQFQLISKVLDKNGFDGAKVNIEVLGKVGDNYMANVKRIVAEKDGKVFKIVAKIATVIPHVRDAQHVKLAFNNESVMYNEILPKLRELEISAGIPETKRFKFPACYGLLSDDMNEIILLEDLLESGYTMLDKLKSLNDDSVKLVLKNFAQLHALSYALNSKEPKTFKKFQSKLLDLWDNVSMAEIMAPVMEASERDIIALLDQEKYRKAVKGSVSKLNENYLKLHKYNKDSRFSVILHGDAWTNNMMFHVEEGTTVDCCLIDYQISKVGNPVTDITYFLFFCTDYETRKAHFYDWIDFYHSELDNYLFLFGLRAAYVYPREQLDADLKRHSKVAFATSVILCTVLLRETSEAEKFKSAMQETDMSNVIDVFKITNLKESSIAFFKNKLEGVVDSFYDFGYFIA